MLRAYDDEPAPPPTAVDVLPPPGDRHHLAFTDPKPRYSGTAYRNAMRRDDPAGFRTLTRTGFTDDHWEALAEALSSLQSASSLPWHGYLWTRYIDAMSDPAERRWHQITMIVCDNGPDEWEIFSNWLKPYRAARRGCLRSHGLIRMLVNAERLVSHLATLEDPLCPGRRELSPLPALPSSREYPLLGQLAEYWRASVPAAELARALPPTCFAAFEPLAPARAQLAALSVESLFQIYNQLVEFGTQLDDNPARGNASVQRWWRSWTRHHFGYDLAIHFDTFDAPLRLRKALQSLRAARLAFDPSNPENLRVLEALGVIHGRNHPPPPHRGLGNPPAMMDVPRVYALLTEYEAFLAGAEAQLTSA